MKPVKDYINLLPRGEKKSFRLVAGKGMLFSVLFVLIWLGLFGWQVNQQTALRGKLASLTAKKQALKQQADAMLKERGIAAPGAEVEKTALVQSLLDERVRWSEVFRQFSQIVPQGLWFDSLEGSTDVKAEVKIRGGAFNYTSVSDFMLAMEKSGYFEGSRLSYAQKAVVQGRDVVGFEIVSGITKTQGAR